MMQLVSRVLVECADSWTEINGLCYLHWCPGCEQMHIINTEKPNRFGAIWKFDGNLEIPTFSPSINHPGYCHYFIRAGKIEYCPDSTHKFSGQTIPMPDFPEDMI
jgi:hypothetical protein